MKRAIERTRFALWNMVHPFKGFWDLKYEKSGSLPFAVFLLAALVVTEVCKELYTDFVFNLVPRTYVNVPGIISGILLPFLLWCVANWCLTTLFDGKGNLKNIIIYSSYALLPMTLLNIPYILLSRIFTLKEAGYASFLLTLGIVWSVALMLLGTMVVHEYSMKKTLLCIVFIIVGMALMIFIGFLLFSVIQQMYGFIYVLFTEIRLRV